MSPAAMRILQPGGEHDQTEMLSVPTPVGRCDKPSTVTGLNDFQSAGLWPVAVRIGFDYVVPVKDGEASLTSYTVRDIESATVRKLKEKGFDWRDTF